MNRLTLGKQIPYWYYLLDCQEAASKSAIFDSKMWSSELIPTNGPLFAFGVNKVGHTSHTVATFMKLKPVPLDHHGSKELIDRVISTHV